MRGPVRPKAIFKIRAVAFLLFVSAAAARGQTMHSPGSSGNGVAEPVESPADVRALVSVVRDLQAEVQALHSQLGEVQAEQQRASEEARVLRHELEAMKSSASPAAPQVVTSYARESIETASSVAGMPAISLAPTTQATTQTQGSTEQRLAQLEEAQDVMEGKINDQYQTKVESGSKYRVRLSGIALLNLFENRGTVDNLDFPAYAVSEQSQAPNSSAGNFGATLRQSQVRLQAFGPDIAGAHTSADVNLDFAGGLVGAPNGSAMGELRLRTATIRLDWNNTSIIAGQDRMFFAPLAPTSLATLAVPALSYAGNLWAWMPQVRLEHRIALSDDSSISLQAAVLDNLTGDVPSDGYERYPSWGEQSGLPAFATRVSWSRRMLGQDLVIGAGGFYGRQNWGFEHNVDGWAGTVDLTVPITRRLEFTGAFYRGRAVAGLGGGIGQSVLLDGPFLSPATRFRGLDSTGGWAQLKFKVRSNFEINGAFGTDNPYAGELRQFSAHSIYPGPLSRNLSPLVNFIYQIRSDILISTEYRYIRTSVLDSGSNSANHINLSLGYIF